MGAYLSEPVLEKHSEDGEGKFLTFGSSSMQGWRVSQEDAHNAILDYEAGKSFFAVYDGHGGHEVAAYCALRLPDFIKDNPAFKEGDYRKALEETFIEFDSRIIQRDVVEELKKLAGCVEEEQDQEGKEEEREEVNHLCEEASMPIEAVIAKLANGGGGGAAEAAEEVTGALKPGPAAAPHSALRKLQKEEGKKPVSPFLRAKPDGADLREGNSNKHIHFNAEGDEVKTEDTVEEKAEEAAGGPVTPVNGEPGKPEALDSSPEGSEKENKDTNGAQPAAGEVTDAEGNLVTGMGKGKGKGKGKSRGKSEDCVAPLAEEKKKKKSANEIYESLSKATPDEGDEDSEDSEDEEFEGMDDSEDEDEDEAEDVDSEEDADSDDEEDEDEEEEEDDDEIPEADFTEEPGNDSGCTAVVALLAGTRLYVANAGDSRCVVCRNGVAVEMSFDHKPEDEVELRRIRTAGGKVTPDGRVNGGLNLSRAIGDHAYKRNESLSLSEQMISPQPDVKVLDIDPATDDWMILACDGIWNFMSSQEVVDYVAKKIDKTPDDKLSTICEELFEHCLAPDTMGDGTGCDNMTAVIVKFKLGLSTLRDVVSNGSSVATNGATNGSVNETNGSSKRPDTDSEKEESVSKRPKLDNSS